MSGRKSREARRTVAQAPPAASGQRRSPVLLLGIAAVAAVVLAAAVIGASLAFGDHSTASAPVVIAL